MYFSDYLFDVQCSKNAHDSLKFRQAWSTARERPRHHQTIQNYYIEIQDKCILFLGKISYFRLNSR